MSQDAHREQRIKFAFKQMMAISTPKDRRRHYNAMVREIEQRSPEQIARMERHVRQDI